MKEIILPLFLLLFIVITNAQDVNLLINGDFEEIENGNVFFSWEEELTPDFRKNDTSQKEESNTVGLAFTNTFTEALISKLKKPLHANQNYHISLDIFFGRSCTMGFDTLFLVASPTAEIKKNTIFRINLPIGWVKPFEWTTISMDFNINEEMNYIALGCFEKYAYNVSERKRKIDLDDVKSISCSYIICDNIKIIEKEEIKKDRLIIERKQPKSQTKSKKKLVVFFESNKSDLNKKNSQMVANFCSTLEKERVEKIKIVGFADDVGSINRNYILSKNRAKAVKKALLYLGFDENLIEISAQGEIPLVGNDVANERNENRRVDVQFF